MTDDIDIQLGGVPATQPESKRLSLFLWGQAGVGKTTLASTMPGRIALLNFDPDGPASIPDAANVKVFDLSGSGDRIAEQFMKDDPLNIKASLDQFDSYIFDSLTTIEERNLGYGISKTNGATIIRPSPGAYGARGNIMVQLVRNVLAITAAAEKHVCFIGHEAPPTTNDDGNVLHIGPALGGKTPQAIALRVNECWAMFENSSRHKMIAVRQSRLRQPIKTRMFDTMKEPEFAWRWNANDRDDPKNMHIGDWFKAWQEGGYRKLSLPS